jgi:hypothetical protein
MKSIPRSCLILLMVLGASGPGCAGDSEPSSERPPEEEQSSLPMLDAAMQPLRRDFEDRYGCTRLVAVLSSSCSHCVDNARRLYETAIPRLQEMGIEVSYVWGSVLPTDTRIRARELAEEMYWPSLHHYYDESGRTTRAFGRAMGLGPNTNAYDVFFLYGPEASWDPDGAMEEEPADFNVADVFWAPARPDRWWADPERYPGFRRMWVAEILKAVGVDTLATSDSE